MAGRSQRSAKPRNIIIGRIRHRDWRPVRNGNLLESLGLPLFVCHRACFRRSADGFPAARPQSGLSNSTCSSPAILKVGRTLPLLTQNAKVIDAEASIPWRLCLSGDHHQVSFSGKSMASHLKTECPYGFRSLVLEPETMPFEVASDSTSGVCPKNWFAVAWGNAVSIFEYVDQAYTS